MIYSHFNVIIVLYDFVLLITTEDMCEFIFPLSNTTSCNDIFLLTFLFI
jgi:hypothetical protein